MRSTWNITAGSYTEMKMVELSDEEIRYVYEDHMRKDFPPDELKPLFMIRQALQQGWYKCYGLKKDEELLGYAFTASDVQTKACLLDYFAVISDQRGQGYGSRLLQMLSSRMAPGETLIIEVEDPETALSMEEKTVRERRIDFYRRNGAKNTSAKVILFGVTYLLLEITAGEGHAPEEAAHLYDSLMQLILSKPMYEKHLAFL